MKVVGNTDRMNVILDTDAKEIDVTQSWYFQFHPYPASLGIAHEMNHGQQTLFKSITQRLIRKLWASKACLELVSTTDPKLLSYVGTVFNIRVCIREVSMADAAHWNVNIVNVPGGATSEGLVQWETRSICLTTEAINNREDISPSGSKYRQYVAAHEFGHAFGNAWELRSIGMTGDEYHTNSPHFSDIDSIMNVGNRVRKRHYEYVRYVLEELVMPGTVFKTELR